MLKQTYWMTSFWDSALAEGHACGRQRETTNGVLEGEVGAIQGVFPALMYFQSGPKIWWFKGKAGVKQLCLVHYITHYSGHTLNILVWCTWRGSILVLMHLLKCSLLSLTDGSILTRVSALLAETEARRQSWWMIYFIRSLSVNIQVKEKCVYVNHTSHAGQDQTWRRVLNLQYTYTEAPDGKSLC